MKKMFNLVIIIVLLAGLSACNVVDVFNSNAKQVKESAAEITEFDLPEGFSPAFSFKLDALTIAAYDHESGIGHIYLVQSTNESDAARLESFLNQQTPGSGDWDNRTEVIENRPVTVRGEETVLIISDGTNGDGKAYRQAMCSFEGNGGPAMLVVSMPEQSWNDEVVENLIASMR